MERSGPRARTVVVALVSALIAVGLATMGGIVARATPASAARLSYAVVRDHLDLTDPSRTTPPRGSHGTLPYRYLHTELYLPVGAGPFPVVVFAAGFDISTEAYTPMLMQWAAAGYVVAAPQFPISGQPSDGPARRDDMVNEPGDISFVISSLQSASSDPASPVHDLVDGGRVGVAGHSDGGTDAAAIAYNSRVMDGRVRAVMVLAGDPPVFPGSTNGPTNRAAVLVMNGTADGIAAPGGGDVIYATAAPPKVQVQLVGAGHLDPFVTDSRFTAHAWPLQIDFLDATLRDDATGRSRLSADASNPDLLVRQDGLQPNPFGTLDTVAADVLGNVTASGWAADPDTTGPVPVHVWVDGVFEGEHLADLVRPDVGAAYPDLGSAHGYRVTVPHLATGTHQLCVYAINVGLGDTNVRLGCQGVEVTTNPFGSLDKIDGDALLRRYALGWAIDPDSADPIEVHVYVDGAKVGAAVAGGYRPDLAAAFPGFGPNHAFVLELPLMSHGTHEVCLYGINVGSGTANSLLGCARTFVDHNPFGVIDAVQRGIGGSVRVAGWALDPDSTSPINVHVYVDGVKRADLPTTVERPDVADLLGGGGTQHGFDVDLAPLPDGQHTVCVYAINTGGGSTNPLIDRCRPVTVSHLPVGSLDAVEMGPGGTIEVAGWAIDPDAAAPIDVHVYIDGVMRGSGTAGAARPDIGAAFPPYGANHGYTIAAGTVTAGAQHLACAYGINVAVGHNELLGCQYFTVP